MAAPPVIHDHAVEGLFLRGLGERVTPALKARLRAVGLDLDRRLAATYPRDMWLQVLRVTIEELYPGVPLAEAYRKLGEVVPSGIGKTLMGSAGLSVARLMGARRALPRIGDVFASANNFMRTKATLLSPTEVELWVSDTYSQPTYLQGALEVATRLLNVKNVRVEILRVEDPACTYRIRWTEGS